MRVILTNMCSFTLLQQYRLLQDFCRRRIGSIYRRNVFDDSVPMLAPGFITGHCVVLSQAIVPGRTRVASHGCIGICQQNRRTRCTYDHIHLQGRSQFGFVHIAIAHLVPVTTRGGIRLRTTTRSIHCNRTGSIGICRQGIDYHRNRFARTKAFRCFRCGRVKK